MMFLFFAFVGMGNGSGGKMLREAEEGEVDFKAMTRCETPCHTAYAHCMDT